MTEALPLQENGKSQTLESDMKAPVVPELDGHLERSGVLGEPDDIDHRETEDEDPKNALLADETDTETEDEGDFWITSRRPPDGERAPQETPMAENDDVPRKRRSSSVLELASKFKNAIVSEAEGFAKDTYELAVGIKEGVEITMEDTLSLKDKLVSSTTAALATRSDGIIGLLRRKSSSLVDRDSCKSPTKSEDDSEGSSPRLNVNPLQALSKGLRANLALSQDEQDANSTLALQEGSLEEVHEEDEEEDATGRRSVSTPTDALEKLLSGDEDIASKPTSKAQLASTSVAQAASASMARVGQLVRSIAKLRRTPTNSKASSSTSLPSKEQAGEEPAELQRPEEIIESEGVSSPGADNTELTESDSSNVDTDSSSPSPTHRRKDSSSPSSTPQSTNSQGNVTVIGALKESSKMAQAVSSGLLRQASGLSGKFAAATRGRSREEEKTKDESRSRSHNSRSDDVEDSIFAICSDEDDDMFADEAFQTCGGNGGATNGKPEVGDVDRVERSEDDIAQQ